MSHAWMPDAVLQALENGDVLTVHEITRIIRPNETYPGSLQDSTRKVCEMLAAQGKIVKYGKGGEGIRKRVRFGKISENETGERAEA